MRKFNKLTIILSASSLAFMGMAVLLVNEKTEYQETNAYSTTSLPTTIDLNDTSASNIRNYYSSLNNLSASERQGTNLLKNLKTILKNGQKYLSYDSGNAIWQIYEITDRDWDKSPASSTTYGTYNANTNILTNYQYGTSSSNSKNNPYIHALYINRNIENLTTAWDDHQQTEWGINREHVWPKAEGFEESGAGGARGDPMHLMAGNGYSNNIHSNYFYGYVNTSSSYTNCGTKYSNQNGNLLGKSKTVGGTTNVFEPQDSDKGDIARAIFYMVARYNYLSGSDADGIDSDNPNLTLTQTLSDWESSGYVSTTSNPGKMGILTDLLAWHHADPVDEYEIHRNNLLYTNYTNNRNPFIDFPEWVDFIWGTATYSGTTYQSYNSAPTGFATPSSDTINGYNDTPQQVVSVTGVSLSKNSTTIEEGSSEQLTATISPNNATNKGLIWSSSDDGVASVADGNVTANSVGNATITVTTSDGGFTATCLVTVTAAPTTSSGSVTASSGAFDGWTSYNLGSAYSDGSAKFDSTGDYVYKLGIFSGNVSQCMTNLKVTINGKINGTATSANSYKVEAISGTESNIVSKANDVKTGADIYTGSYGDATFEMSSGLSGTTGIRVTYATKGGGNWGIMSISWVATYELPSIPASITATVSKTFSVGEKITKSDIVVEDNLGNTITNFNFSNNNYQFVYSDASSGGASTNKVFSNAITYNDFSCDLTVSVKRTAYTTPDDETITLVSSSVFSQIGGGNSNLKDGTVTSDGITYEYYKAYYYSSGASLSFGNGSSQVGYLTNQTAFSTDIKDVSITSSGRAVNIRYSEDGSNWDLKANADVNTNSYRYMKIDCIDVSGSNYSNITQIVVTLFGAETASNVANYIMFEDTNNQCTTKFSVAKKYFENMSTSDRNTFMSSDDYVISIARERFVAWANNQGKAIIHINGDYEITNNVFVFDVLTSSENNKVIVGVAIFSAMSVLTLLVYSFVRHKKEI